MNEKDTIIKLQNEVIDALKRELRGVRYCSNTLIDECNKLRKKSKHNSRCYYVMGIGTGLILSNIIDYCIDKKKNKKSTDANTNQCNE